MKTKRYLLLIVFVSILIGSGVFNFNHTPIYDDSIDSEENEDNSLTQSRDTSQNQNSVNSLSSNTLALLDLNKSFQDNIRYKLNEESLEDNSAFNVTLVNSDGFNSLVYSAKDNLVFGCNRYLLYIYNRTDSTYKIISEKDGIGKGDLWRDIDYDPYTNKMIMGAGTRLSIFNLPSLTLNFSTDQFPLVAGVSGAFNMLTHDQYGNIYIATQSKFEIYNIQNQSHSRTIQAPEGWVFDISIDYDITHNLLYGANTNSNDQFGWYNFTEEMWEVYNVSANQIGCIDYIESLNKLVLTIKNNSKYYLGFFDKPSKTLSVEEIPLSDYNLPTQVAYDENNGILYLGGDYEFFQYNISSSVFTNIGSAQGLFYGSHKVVTIDQVDKKVFVSSGNGLYEYDIASDLATHLSVGINSYLPMNAFGMDQEEDIIYMITGDLDNFNYLEMINATTMESLGVADEGTNFHWGGNSKKPLMFVTNDSVFIVSSSGFMRYFKENNTIYRVAPEGISDFRVLSATIDIEDQKILMFGYAPLIDWDTRYFWSFEIATQTFTNNTLENYSDYFSPSCIFFPENNSVVLAGGDDIKTIYIYNITNQSLTPKYIAPTMVNSIYYDNETRQYFLGCEAYGVIVLDRYFTKIVSFDSDPPWRVFDFARGNNDLLYVSADRYFGVCNTTSLKIMEITLEDGLPISPNYCSKVIFDIKRQRILIGHYIGLISYNITLGKDYFSPAAINLESITNGSILSEESLINLTIVSDTLNSTLYNWDFTENQTLYSPWDIIVPSTEGWYSLNVFAITRLGTVTHVQIQVYIDAISPMVELEDYTNNSALLPIEQINLTVYDNNLEQVWYNWNDQENQSGGNPLIVVLPAINSVWHKLSVFCNDTVGHLTSENYYFFSDIEPPEISLLFPENDTILSSNQIIQLNISDFSLDTIWFNWNNIFNMTIISPWKVNTPSYDGYHWLTVYANDSLDHISIQKYCWSIITPSTSTSTLTTTNPVITSGFELFPLMMGLIVIFGLIKKEKK